MAEQNMMNEAPMTPPAESMPAAQPITQAPGAMVPPMQAASPAAPGGEMSEEEMRSTLNTQLADLKRKRGALNSEEYINKNKINEAKAQMIQSVFKILQDVGVDPTNMESIQSFIQQLEEQDPDLLALFNVAFDALEGADMSLSAAPTAGPMIPGEQLPIGTEGMEPDMPLPPKPDDFEEAPASPGGPEVAGLGAKYNNIAGAVNNNAV